MIKAFKRRLSRKSKQDNQRGQDLRNFSWGTFRNSNDDVFKELIKPINLTLFKDDVGPVIEPQYPNGTIFTLMYTGLYCRKRTGDRGWFGPSDEPYVITSAVTVVNGDNIIRTERHPIGDPDKRYGDVDSSEFREGPNAACWSGVESEISLVVTVMENDEGDPDAYKDEIGLIVELAADVAKIYGVPIPDALQQLAVNAINWVIDSEDDNIGTETLILSPFSLKLAALVAPGYIFKDGGVDTTIQHNRFTYHDDDGEYFTLFRIDANQDPIPVGPEIFNRPEFVLNNNKIQM
jgi:hypothetical protein